MQAEMAKKVLFSDMKGKVLLVDNIAIFATAQVHFS